MLATFVAGALCRTGMRDPIRSAFACGPGDRQPCRRSMNAIGLRRGAQGTGDWRAAIVGNLAGGDMRLSGKVALITGGGAGIGRTGVDAFLREGARVMVAEFSPEAI